MEEGECLVSRLTNARRIIEMSIICTLDSIPFGSFSRLGKFILCSTTTVYTRVAHSLGLLRRKREVAGTYPANSAFLIFPFLALFKEEGDAVKVKR